ncbi:hypothetical protein EDD86DRAFT_191225, partial [Gorgonomyces haynaldii]
PTPTTNRTKDCQDAVQQLVTQYTGCLGQFPSSAKTVEEADQRANDFVKCICTTSWSAGSATITTTTTEWCPAPGGISKENQILIAASCADPSPNAQRGIPLAFGLATTVNGKKYVPNSGLPPGMVRVPRSSAVGVSISGFFALLVI